MGSDFPEPPKHPIDVRSSETRRKLLEALARDRIRFQAFHVPFPRIGRVRAVPDGAYEFVPERRCWDSLSK